ncbi:MAG: Gfo/Idh/MocA family oxidoreductase [bacterium]
MRFLVVGLGSLGKRRIRNLKYLQSGTIIGCDPRLDRRDETSQRYRIQTFENFNEAMNQDPEILIISASPNLRLHYALEAAAANKHFFAEACPQDEQMTELVTMLQGKKIVAAPSCTLCFYPGPKKVKNLLLKGTIGQPLSFTYHSGQYLPGWHPAEDFWPFSDSPQSPEAYREILPFELVWLSILFGSIESVSTFKGKVGNSEVDMCDAPHRWLLRFESGTTGYLLLDMTSRAPIQRMHLTGEEGHIEWDNREQLIRIYSGENCLKQTEPLIRGCVENMYIKPEEPYVDELRSFLEAIYGIAPFPHTFKKHQEILTLVDQSGEAASKERKGISAPEPEVEVS